MKIHILTNLFHPDTLGGAALFTDFAQFFSEAGHDVRITTTFSYYPNWKLRPCDQGKFQSIEQHRNMPLKRVKMFVPRRVNAFTRLLSELSFLISLNLFGRFKNWTPDVLVTACPMLSQCLAIPSLTSKGQKSLIILQDFVLDAAMELKLIKGSILPQLLNRIEAFALRQGDMVSTISPRMAAKLSQRLGRDAGIFYIPNWIHRSLEDALNSAREKQRSRNVLLYSGNLGLKQGISHFIDTFVNANTDWVLRIHGGGVETEALRQKVAHLPNVIISPVLEEQEYVHHLKKATACLVIQKHGMGANFLPSKLLPALASGTPVLAVCDSGTPLADEVARGSFGVIVSPNDPAKLGNTLKSWENNQERLETLGSAAQSWSRNFERTLILGKYAQLLNDLTISRSRRNPSTFLQKRFLKENH